jgi:molybdopterin adenylyltransferase
MIGYGEGVVRQNIIRIFMTDRPHPDNQSINVNCAILTISDTRTIDTDTGGQLARQLLSAAGHVVTFYQIIPDEPAQIVELVDKLAIQGNVQAIILSGGTGIAPRDRTYEALTGLFEKVLPGFGELFRSLSYTEIGTRTISSRSIAGTYQGMIIFALPGSRGAVELGISKIILPELLHLVGQLRQN